MRAKDDLRIRSWIFLLAGLAGIGYQQWSGEVNGFLLATYLVMTGIPGIAELFSLIRNSPVVLQSSSSQPEQSEPELDTSSSGTSDER